MCWEGVYGLRTCFRVVGELGFLVEAVGEVLVQRYGFILEEEVSLLIAAWSLIEQLLWVIS